MATPPGWRPSPPTGTSSPHTPPQDTNGWGRYVAATLEHILVRLHYLEQSHDELRSKETKTSSLAPIAAPSSQKEIWSERKETAKEVSTGLRWLAVVLLFILLAGRIITLSDLKTLGKLYGIGG